MKILLIDNYDSFTYNLYHYISKFEKNVDVIRNDKINSKNIFKKKYNKIVISLGSRAAEMIIFGSKEVTQGSQKELENVYFWANQMVTKFGFSDLGPITYDSEKDTIFLGKDLMKNKKEYSQKTSREIDKQIISIANKAVNHAIFLLSDKVSLMDNLVDELIVKETLESDFIIDSLNSYLSSN